MDTWTMPYLVEEDYIFISYSHKDSEEVLKVIAYLSKQGIRIWHYQEGTLAGKEWDENIAFHIDGCSGMIAFVSKNYLTSDNCKNEINYARDLNKKRQLIYLEEVSLPSGMAMRLNRLQSIHKYKYYDEADFYQKLLQSNIFASSSPMLMADDVQNINFWPIVFKVLLFPLRVVWLLIKSLLFL